MTRLLLIGFLFCWSSASALEATVKTKEVIEWVTASRTYPEIQCNERGVGFVSCPAVYIPVICNQIGTKYQLLIAEIDWNGEVKVVELERKRIPTEEKLEHSFPCNEVFP